LVFTGCQKNGTKTSTSKAVEEVVNIRVAYYAVGEAAETMQKIVDLFMIKNPNIKIETFQSSWTGHYEKLRAELAAGDAPDVYLLDGVYIPQYAERGVLEDLTQRAAGLDEDNFLGLKQLRTPDNKLYGIPQGIQVDVLYYNKDMFDEAGLDYPTSDWTLDDLARNAKLLTNDDHWGFAIPLNQIRCGWYPIIRQFGGDFLDKTRTKSVIKTDKKIKEALVFMHDAFDKYKYVPNAEDMAGVLTSKAHTYFPREKVAMFYDCYVGVTRNNGAGINYDVVIQPKQNNRYASFIANSWVLNKKSDEAEKNAGWKFMEYYLSEEAQNLHIESANSLPANRAVMMKLLTDNTTNPENKLAFFETFGFAGTLAENAVWAEQNNAFQGHLSKYVSNEETLDEFINNTDKEIQSILDDFYKK